MTRMNHFGITKASFNNGEGARCVLWVSGCGHHCKECHNPESWDADYGDKFTRDDYLTIRKAVSRVTIDGLTLSGGDPMYPDNRSVIYDLCRMFRRDFGDRKTIWMYTGYTMEKIKGDPILEYIDVVVDGPYIEGLPNAPYRGSNNQRIWRKTDGIWAEMDM